MKFSIFFTAWLLILIMFCKADIKSTTGNIRFKVNQTETQMILSQNGLSLGQNNVPSANLDVSGNAIITNSLSIGSNPSNSNLHLNGSLGFGLQSTSSNTTLDNSSFYLADSFNGNLVLSLPYAGNVTGRQITIKKTSASHEVIIKGGDNLIDQVEQVLMEETNQLVSAIKLFSDGEQWRILSMPNTGTTLIEGYQPSDNNLTVWFDASDSSSISLISGNVAQWSDKSGNGDHAVQASSNMQPQYLSQNKLYFYGLQSLTASSISDLNTWSGNRTIAVVTSFGPSSANTILHWGAGTSTFRDEQIVVDGTNTKQSLVDGHSQGIPSFTTTSTDDVGNGMVMLYSVDTDGVTFDREIRINGNASFNNSSDRTSNISPDSTLHIGQDFDGTSYRVPGSFAHDVYIHEIIIYPSSFPTSDLEKIEGYLMHKWDLIEKFDITHPYYYHQPESN